MLNVNMIMFLFVFATKQLDKITVSRGKKMLKMEVKMAKKQAEHNIEIAKHNLECNRAQALADKLGDFIV